MTPDLLRSDHAPFWYKNIGAVMVTDTSNFRNPHYHQPSDTSKTLDRSFLTGATQRVLNGVTQLLDSRGAWKQKISDDFDHRILLELSRSVILLNHLAQVEAGAY